jgi:hypothetical protein
MSTFSATSNNCKQYVDSDDYDDIIDITGDLMTEMKRASSGKIKKDVEKMLHESFVKDAKEVQKEVVDKNPDYLIDSQLLRLRMGDTKTNLNSAMIAALTRGAYNRDNFGLMDYQSLMTMGLSNCTGMINSSLYLPSGAFNSGAGRISDGLCNSPSLVNDPIGWNAPLYRQRLDGTRLRGAYSPRGQDTMPYYNNLLPGFPPPASSSSRDSLLHNNFFNTDSKNNGVTAGNPQSSSRLTGSTGRFFKPQTNPNTGTARIPQVPN